ncbi:Flavodoxin/ferredoxin--NADP reductase [Buchnera aphidicola (Phyllaphis fagi)]|uniref:FAD-binding oxidoreductase n=1 Tax=Buchnera aphidicola TaxID=9 RepID=UPI003464940C
MTQWINARVIRIQKWTSNLFKLFLKSSILPFISGQFTKIAIINKNKYIQRAYSFVNDPKNKNLEFCITLIQNGIMSNKLYHLLKNQKILLSQHANGFFTIYEIPNCEILWMFSTGTAIGPFCSILQDGSQLKKFKKIILIHAVRYKRELIYSSLIKKLKKKYINQLIFQTIVSREYDKTSLIGRIPQLLHSNDLENQVGHIITPNTSHVMLCGNPNMVKETQLYLINNRSLKKHFRRNPGHISSEHYW